MKKTFIKFILLIAVIVTAITSCKKLEDLNVNEKAATAVPSETLFANGIRNLVDQATTCSNNFNVLRLFSQYWAATTYPDETRYDIISRPIPANEFISIYRDALSDLKEAKRVVATESSVLSSDAEKKNKSAICDIVMVYGFQREVDIFGNIPYSEALDPNNISPVYDDAQSIYANMFSVLDAAINSIDANAASFGSADVVYGGDAGKWKKFANTLKIKMAITVADVPALDPAGKISSALASGAFASAVDNGAFHYLSSPPNTNPVWLNIVSANRKDWVASNTIIDLMNSLNDPRRAKYFLGNIKDSVNNVIYVGGEYGALNTYASFTQLTTTILAPDREALLLDYTELQFYLAEAAARNFIGANAGDYYKKGIISSFEAWGITDTAVVNPYLRTKKVDYSDPLSGATFKEKIATQAWLAYFDRGDIAWTTWRRLDAPKFNPPKNMTNADIPVRYTYPGTEQTLNGANYTAAAAAIGGDTKATKIFWDKF